MPRPLQRSTVARVLVAMALVAAAAPAPLAAQAPCQPGSWSATGRQPCTLASPGHYVPKAGAKSQTAAPVGLYVPKAGATSLTPAPRGYYVPSTKSTAPIPASLGFYVPKAESSKPTPAPAGFYVGKVAASLATPCPASTNSYGQAPACRFTGGPGAPAVPGAIGPRFASSFAPGLTIDVGVIRLGATLTLDEWIRNASADLAALGGFGATPVLQLTELTVLGASYTPVAQLHTTIAGLPNGLVLGEGAQQPFSIALTGVRGGSFLQTFSVATDQSADFGAAGQTYRFSVRGSVTPEPSTLSLLALGALGLGVAARRRRSV